jgi:quercetin dioxygenase-like cupin family protein
MRAMRASHRTSFAFGALAGAALALGGVAASRAAGGPSAPAAPWVARTAKELTDLDHAYQGANKTADFVAGAPVPYTAGLMHEEDKALGAAEVHDAKDHIIYIVEGKTTFHIGGTLEGAHEESAGEWRGPRVSGHKVVEAKKGDLVIIPRGTPHFRTTKGSKVSMLMVQVFSANQGPAAKK